jgi:hypothetical protein
MSVRAPVRTVARLLVVALAVALTGAIAAPARACACGALLSNDPRLRVSGETSVVRWDGAREEIVMSMAVTSSRKDAALLLPTPAPATVRLGDDQWTETLGRISSPDTRAVASDWWPSHLFDPGPMVGSGAVPHRPDVTVQSEANVGPYHVASLSARDPKALAAWLKTNGYRLKGSVAAGLAPYVKMGWRYTAVKLRATGGRHGETTGPSPSASPSSGAGLTGSLSPLRIRFAAKAPVYPMRLSHAITADQSVRLYVLSAHRMRPRTGGISFDTSYAGRVDPRSYQGSFTGLLAHGTTFLTTLDGTARPGAVNDDIRFARVADTPYARSTTVEEPVYIMGVAGGPFLVFLGLLLLVAAAVVVTAVVAGRRSGRRSVHTGSSGS